MFTVEPPPCRKPNEKPNACAAGLYDQIVNNHINLTGPWAGWRMAGRDLVSPDRQRINPQRLRGLLFRQAMEERLAKVKARRKADQRAQVVLLPPREKFDGCA